MAPSIVRLRSIVPSDPDRTRRRFVALLGLCLGLLILDRPAMAQSPVPNYDETKVGLYTLPDPLMGSDGERVTTAEAWNTRRRPEIMKLFETYMYGKVPTPIHPIKPTFTVCSPVLTGDSHRDVDSPGQAAPTTRAMPGGPGWRQGRRA
jgi:hypothetical protein